MTRDEIHELLSLMVKKEISDIHFKAGCSPALRAHGGLVHSVLGESTPEGLTEMANELMNPKQRAHLEEEGELDFAYTVPEVARFRINVCRQQKSLALTMRVLPLHVRDMATLNLPEEVLKKLCEEKRGLILVAGNTGAGKTTTLNAMVDYLNRTYEYKVVTVEDPVEYLHKDAKSQIIQREVGEDTKSFDAALKHVLRQDPDVVVVGEMRNAEAMRAGVTAAETGHLVLATVHTVDAARTVDRIVDSYPETQRAQVRSQLSNLIKAVIAQRLVTTTDGAGRIPALEIMTGTSTVAQCIAEGRTNDLLKAIEQGSYYGMQSFDQALVKLQAEGKITLEEAKRNATSVHALELKMKGFAHEMPGGS